ncbi:MAG TPA: glycosyltransferase family 4 protein [Actinomycetes bacterium]|nr:glycosyltransferase family 4 protein [Actinomycetes bacterium]
MHVVVATVVHDPQDARILHREIAALLDAGHTVTYVAPWSATGRASVPEAVTVVDVPRAVGRRRVRALLAARRALRRLAPTADVIVVHDPELLLALPRPRPGLVRVWDVHEDTAATLVAKPWLPRWLRAPLARPVRWAELTAERRVRLVLAEEAYAGRFHDQHPVVRNLPVVPVTDPAPPGADRVVYVGSLTLERGAAEMAELGRRLKADAISVELIGAARDAETRAVLQAAQASGDVDWLGPLPNDVALARVEGALAGLSLLRDLPNYRHSLPTKVVEYMARGVPVVTTPLPVARSLVEQAGAGIVVPFDDVEAAATAVRRLRDDPTLRQHLSRAGLAAARDHLDWREEAPRFLAALA